MPRGVLKENLPSKVCVSCNRPFTWRKKWERCWDEVTTCSKSCNAKRKEAARPAAESESGGKLSDGDARVSRTSTSAAVSTLMSRDPPVPGGSSRRALLRRGGAEADDWQTISEERAQQPSRWLDDDLDQPAVQKAVFDDDTEQMIASLPIMKISSEELKQLNEADMVEAEIEEVLGRSFEAPQESGPEVGSVEDGTGPTEQTAPAFPEGSREWRKAQRKLVKQQRRAERAGAEGVEDHGRKACDLCSRCVDLLVRCTVDASKRWRMACGACWREASGGVTDGDADHPHYTYGGLWKNRAANR